MKKNIKGATVKRTSAFAGVTGGIVESLSHLIGNIKNAPLNQKKKAGALLVLLLAGNVAKALTEEVIATIMFEPKKSPYNTYTYSLSTNPDSRIADKTMLINYRNVGYAIDYLPDYLVKGAKIVYENEGMKNAMRENIGAERMIAIITEDGTYIELTELVPRYEIVAHFDFLYEKLRREGRAGSR